MPAEFLFSASFALTLEPGQFAPQKAAINGTGLFPSHTRRTDRERKKTGEHPEKQIDQFLQDHGKRKHNRLSWGEQFNPFWQLPDRLPPIALVSVNAGCRARELCSLRQERKVRVPDVGTSVFLFR